MKGDGDEVTLDSDSHRLMLKSMLRRRGVSVKRTFAGGLVTEGTHQHNVLLGHLLVMRAEFPR